MKKVGNTYLGILTSILILTVLFYSLIVNEPIYKLTSFLYNVTIIVSIISLAIHFNAFKENNEMKRFTLISVVVPIATIIYTIIGVFIWFYSGN